MMKKNKSIKLKKIDVGQELRNISALVEDNNHKLTVVAEQYGDLQKDVSGIKKTLESHTEMTEELSSDMKNVKATLTSHTEMIGKLAVDVEIVKNNVEFLKGSMKKKVDYDEFLALERRMSLLESKIK